MVSQLGNEIIDHFNDASRGDLVGRNDSGVEFTSILLSLETSGFDRLIRTAAENNGFSQHGLDSLSDRNSNVRDGFSFYRGVGSTGPPGSLSFAQRRRIVIIDNRDAFNPVIRHNDLPLGSGSLGAPNVALIQAAINNTPAPSELDFNTWLADFSPPAGQNGTFDDPDQDGSTNLLEFSSGTDPTNASDFPFQKLVASEDGFQLTVRRFTMAGGIARGFDSGTLGNLSSTNIDESNATSISLGGDIEEVSIPLPANFGPFIRQTVTLP